MSFYDVIKESLRNEKIETRHLLIRPFEERDEKGLFEQFHDANTMYMDGDTPIYEKDDKFRGRIKFIQSGELIWFFIEMNETKDYVGYILLKPADDRKVNTVEIGCSLTVNHQNKGLGYEALTAVIELLKKHGTEMLTAKVWEKNIPSQKLVRKLQFVEEGVKHKSHLDPRTSEVTDTIMFYRLLTEK